MDNEESFDRAGGFTVSYIKGTSATVSESEVVVKAGAFGTAAKTFRAVIERLPTKGTELLFHTYLEMSKNAVSLHGFNRKVDLRLSRALLDMSGVEPKGAFAVLSALEPEALKLAVLIGDAKAIAKAPSVGVRTAERIILELKSQEVVQTLPADTVFGGSVSDAAAAEAIDALVQLGYGIGEATRAVQAVPEAERGDSKTLLREALQQF